MPTTVHRARRPRSMLRLGVVGAAVTTAVAGLGAGVAQAGGAAHLVYVAPAGQGGHGPCAHPGATTVQGGVDAVARGGTVVVCPDTYAGSVSITRTLTLRGLPGAVIDATGHDYGIGIGADHVTVTGMTVRNASGVEHPTGTPEPSGHGDGIITAVDGGQAVGDHARIIGDVTTGNAGAGIDVDSSRGTVVEFDRSSGNGAVGINVVDDFGPAAAGDLVIGNVTSDNPNGCGIALASHGGAGVTGVRVEGNRSDRNGTARGGAGILLASAVPGAVLQDNLIAGNEASGNGHSGFQLHAHAPGDHLAGNRVLGNWFGRNNVIGDAGDPGTTGVFLGTSAGSPLTITVSGNHITDDTVGIFAAGPVDLDAHGNTFRGVTHPVVTQPSYAAS